MEFLHVYPIHLRKQCIVECCDLINSEWPRSKTARFQSLNMSSNKFPTSLVLILKEEQVVGHVKLTELKLGGPDIMIESMIIQKEHRGKGWGKVLMEEAEQYCRSRKKKILYLSTRGQEGFYKKMGYEECNPISYFGFCDKSPQWMTNEEMREKVSSKEKKSIMICPNAPVPPPLPKENNEAIKYERNSNKTYMYKNIV